jgi:hypothetical protein
MAQYRQATLVPFILNTHGGMGPEAIAFCKEAATFASTSGPHNSQWDYPIAYATITNAVTASIHDRLQAQIDSYIATIRSADGL